MAAKPKPMMGNRGGPFQVLRGDPPPAGDCRECGRPSWTSDDVGAVHPCCARNGPECFSCAAAAAAGEAQARRKRR